MIRAGLPLASLLISGCGPVCAPGRICVIMGSGELGFNGDGLPALETRLASPTSVGVGPDGRPFVADYSNMRIRALNPDGTIETLAGSGIHAYSEVGVHRLETPLENPVDAAWGPDGDLHIVPQHEGRVIRIGGDETVEACAGTGVVADTGDGGDALDAEMGFGGGLAFADDGTLYVSDNTFSRVRRVDLEGRIDTILGTGMAGDSGPGHGPQVPIRSPERVVVDQARDRLLVADTQNHRVLSVDLTSLEVTVVAGTGERGDGGDGGPATEARLDTPVGLAVHRSGTVVISDLGNDALRAVGPDGDIVRIAGGAGSARSETSGLPLELSIRGPAGLAWSLDGDLLIAERAGHRVLRWMGADDAL